MSLNKQRGNMYPFVTHTWNPIKGKCPVKCSYCYVNRSRAKRFYEGTPKLYETEFNTNLGSGNYIFVGSMIDVWHPSIPDEWITEVFNHCRKYPNNTYLFQSKNPGRFHYYAPVFFDTNTIWATTIESNRRELCGGSFLTEPLDRAWAIRAMPYIYRTMISIEPIMEFDLDEMVQLIAWADPDYLIIGADSGSNDLIEPSTTKIRKFLTGLKLRLQKRTRKQYMINIVYKDNLKYLQQREAQV